MSGGETVDWLVLGGSGQVGRALGRALQPLGSGVSLSRRECDLSEKGAVADAIARYSPAVVINAAAYTAVDRAESEPELARRINAAAVAELAHACASRDIPLVHYSTDYVFAGQGDTAYRDSDATGPLSVYGKTKLEGEQAIVRAGAKALVLRTSWVYAAQGHNFVNTMLRLAREHEVLRIIDDQVGAPTWAETIADVTALVLHDWRRSGWSSAKAGTYHLTSSGETSWHGLAVTIFEEAVTFGLLERDKIPRVEAIASHEYPQPAPRPGNSRLDTSRLETAFELTMPDWRVALRACLQSMV